MQFTFSLMLFLIYVASGFAATSDVDTLLGETQPSLHTLLDEIVVTATRTKLPAWRSPVPVSFITSTDLDRRGGISLGDVLERSEPMTLRRYGAGAALTTMSIRGMAADQTVFLLNGIQLNSPQNGLVDLSTIPLIGIERIEIARGGASSLYGNHAMGGVVNIITRSTGFDQPIIDVQLGSGSYGLRRFNLQSQINISSFDVTFGLGRDQMEGDFTFVDPFNDNDALTRENADYVQSFATLDGQLRVDSETTLRLFARYTDADRGLPGSYEFGHQAEDRQEDEHVHTAIVLARMVSDDILIEFRPFFIYSDIYYTAPAWDYTSRAINRHYGASFDMDMQIYSGLFATLGGEISSANIDAEALTGAIERVNSVAYLSSEWRAPTIGGVRTIIFPSIRYDRFSNNQPEGDRGLYEEITWKIGATIQPFAYEKFLIRSSIGRNFKAPSLNDLFWVPSGNQDLVPEQSINYDFGIRWDVPFIHGLFIDAGLFVIRARDRIIWIPIDDTFIWGPVNLRQVHGDGFEVDLHYRTNDLPVKLSASYTYQDVRQFLTDEITGNMTTSQLIYVPYHLVSGEIAYDIANLRLSVFPRYNSRRYTTDINDDHVSGYFLFDIRGVYTLDIGSLKAIVSLEVKNLFDTEYQVVKYYPMPGRNYEVNVRLRY